MVNKPDSSECAFFYEKEEYLQIILSSDDMSKWVRELTSEGQMRWVGPEKVEIVINMITIWNILFNYVLLLHAGSFSPGCWRNC